MNCRIKLIKSENFQTSLKLHKMAWYFRYSIYQHINNVGNFSTIHKKMQFHNRKMAIAWIFTNMQYVTFSDKTACVSPA
jgi:hypothetical protein